MSANPTPDLTRREALQRLGAGLSLAGLTMLGARPALAASPDPVKTPPPDNGQTLSPWELPKLPYAYDALEPHIDARTMEIHHSKHHAAYIANAKKLLQNHPDLLAHPPVFLLRHLSIVPEALRDGVRNNVGGIVNHSFFWTVLAPNMPPAPVNTLADAITTQFGSFADFQKAFTEAAMKRFGSGWAWLVVKDHKLQITSTANQDSPESDGATPILGLDVWEHAYYLHVQNRRADYVAAFWNVVNWPQADKYYQDTLTA